METRGSANMCDMFYFYRWSYVIPLPSRTRIRAYTNVYD